MRVAIDYHLYKRNPYSGMGVYVKNLTLVLKKQDRKNKYFTFDFYQNPKDNIPSKILALLKEQLWVQFQFPREIKRENIDLVYFPNPPLSLFISKPTILTIPDVSFYFDGNLNSVVKGYLYFVYFLSAHKSTVITTFSSNSKKDIHKLLKVPERKIFIVSPGVQDGFKRRPKKEVKSTLNKFGIDKKYILSVPGTFIPRKNMKALITIFSRFPKSYQENLILVLVGKNNDFYFKDFKKTVQKLKLENKVKCVGYVSREDLTALYSGAEIFVSPSLYEGFGLPPLEAMACGTPVIVYNRSSFPEVVGNAALIVNNERELKKAMMQLLDDDELRNELVKRGLERAKVFSWRNSVKQFQGVLNKI